MTARSIELTAIDLRLLDTLRREGSLVEACRRLGITRDLGTYRLRRLRRALGKPVVEARRGGARHGTTRLTRLGTTLLSYGTDSVELSRRGSARSLARPHLLRGTWHALPEPSVELEGGVRLKVDFTASEGEPVRLGVDPESILLAVRRYPTSARNMMNAIVEAVRTRGRGTGGLRCLVEARGKGFRLTAAVTRATVREFRLRTGRRVVLYVKATALKRL